VHAFVHVPQCAGSLRTSTHLSPQAICWPLVHVRIGPASASDDASGPPDELLDVLPLELLDDDAPPLLEEAAPEEEEDDEASCPASTDGTTPPPVSSTPHAWVRSEANAVTLAMASQGFKRIPGTS
jgi:hypothetical protein